MNRNKTTRCTKYQLEEKLNEVRMYQKQGLSTKDISEKTNIPVRTIGYYNDKIFKEDKEKWDELSKESLEERAMELKNKYTELGRIMWDISNNDKMTVKDRIEAGKLSIACDMNVYNMLKYGPLKFPTVEAKKLEQKERSYLA